MKNLLTSGVGHDWVLSLNETEFLKILKMINSQLPPNSVAYINNNNIYSLTDFVASIRNIGIQEVLSSLRIKSLSLDEFNDRYWFLL